MKLSRERQRWLAALALAVAIPLPFTGVVSWPFLLPFIAVAVIVLASREPLTPLPAWLENLLAPAIAVAVLAAGGLRYGVLRPVAQLAILVAAVRLPGSGERHRAGTALGLLALVGVAGVASSTHPLLAVYLVGLLALVVTGVARLEGLGLAEDAGGKARVGWWPPARLVAASVALAVLVGAPIFVLFPRLRSPFAASPFGARPVSGFREMVALHGLGAIKESRAEVLRIAFPGARGVDPEWFRLVGATVQHYRGGVWAQGRRNAERLVAGASRVVPLTDEPVKGPLQRAEIELLKESDVLFVPVGAARLELPEGVPVWRDPLGGLRIPRNIPLPLRYAVEFSTRGVVQPPPEADDLRLPRGSEPIAALAREITAGNRGSLAGALSIQEYLRRNFGYTTNLPVAATVREDPVQWFLFRGHAGHCEFFASSMVLLLRSLGVPARLQAGYAGGEREGDGYLVRDSHAHAWVVAHVGSSWSVFDPTPAEGRPSVVDQLAGGALRFHWQELEAAWDRWVLTFSLADQVELVGKAWQWVRGQARNWRSAAAMLAILAGAVSLTRFLLRRLPRIREKGRVGSLERAMARIIDAAQRRQVAPPGPLTPRRFAGALKEAVPGVAAPLSWLVAEHERCAYAGGAPPQRREITRATHAVVRALARTR